MVLLMCNSISWNYFAKNRMTKSMQRAHVTDILSCNVYLQVNIIKRSWGFFLRQTDFLPGHTQVGLPPHTSTNQKDDKILCFNHIKSAESVDSYLESGVVSAKTIHRTSKPFQYFHPFVKQISFQANVAHLKCVGHYRICPKYSDILNPNPNEPKFILFENHCWSRSTGFVFHSNNSSYKNLSPK